MQVSVESGEGLERRMTVELPVGQMDQEVNKRLQRISRTAKMDGFRPGKVPFKVVQRMYGGQVRGEVFGELIQSSFNDAVSQESLRPAGQPRIEPGNADGSETVSYTAVFEVLPQFELGDLEGRTLLQPVTEITDDDLAEMLEKLRKQRVTWNEVDRAAADGDQVTISFSGAIDGEAFAGGEGKNLPLVLGSGSMIDGFEEGLVGAAKGDSRSLDLQFPDDYRVEDLAGKAVSFEVTLEKISEPVFPEVDDEFAKMFGVTEGGIDKLRADIRSNMERELKQRIRARVKNQVMDALLEANPIDLPGVLVDEEIESLRRQTRDRMPGHQAGNMELPRDLFEAQAKRRVALGLVIAEVVKKNNIQLDQDRVRQTVTEFAAEYDDPEEVVKYYYSNREQLAAIESLVLEEQVVDWVKSRLTVAEEVTSFGHLTNNQL